MKKTAISTFILLGAILSLTQAQSLTNDTKEGMNVTQQDENLIQSFKQYINESSCDYYLQFENVFDYCGSSGYVQSFGYPYCLQFLEDRPLFSTTRWNNAVRVCLENKLQDFATSQLVYPSCSTISTAGFGSHPGCYVAPDPTQPDISVCNLSYYDLSIIVWIIKGEWWVAINQGVPVVLYCIYKHYFPQSMI